MGYKNRLDLYIMNTICCKTPDNKNPKPEELKACSNIMKSQIKAVKPKVIVCLGEVAARTLLKQSKLDIEDFRKVHQPSPWWIWNLIPVRVTYHPAHLIRRPDMRVRAWRDMQVVLERLKK